MVELPVAALVLGTVLSLGSSLETPHSGSASRKSRENISCLPGIPPAPLLSSSNFSMDMRMPGLTPAVSDSYLCISHPVPSARDSYIVDFLPHANMDTVHHMLLFGCRRPFSTSGYWDCGGAESVCEDQSSIMYAWGRNAPSTKLPRDVGFLVGKSSKMPHLVLQIHYGDVKAFRDHHRDCSGITLTMTFTPQPFVAGIYLLMSYDTVIAPGNKVTNADVACDYASYPIYPFAFRTHTHRLGKVVSGYRVRDGEWTLIGRQSPQLPQAFYPSTRDVSLKYGDTVAARCMFTGENMTTKTYIGSTASDEMCNFYIMYYMERKHAVPFMSCMDPGSKRLFQDIPAEANIPIPVSPDSAHAAHMMHPAHAAGRQDQPSLGANAEQLDPGFHLEEALSWPRTSLQLGQVSGLALDTRSNLVIFHRGDRRWGADSFNLQGRYQERFLGPIQQSTVLVVDPAEGSVLKASGRNMFYLPHGITTDQDNNYWLTDVALHQVFKVSGDGKDRVLLALGEAFVPGSDSNHFCKPTDVALDPQSGSVFVSDGYCNARILKFSAQGQYLDKWGAGSSDRRRRAPFQVPHSLAFLADRQEVCVADRENGRIQCFLAESGEFVKEIKKEEFGGKVFAISYSPAGGGLIFAVNGVSPRHSAPLRGFVIDYSTKNVLDTFQPEGKGFQMPHDIVESKDGVFVGDVDSRRVFKFTSEKSHRSVKKGGIDVQEVEEVQVIVESAVRPGSNRTSAVGEEQPPAPQDDQQEAVGGRRTLPVLVSVLLLVPLLLIVSSGLFICWRRADHGELKTDPGPVGGIFGKMQGKGVAGLNLGNFFVSHRGYSRQGFDQLSTEGSDQERNQEESSDSEYEEYSTLPPQASS